MKRMHHHTVAGACTRVLVLGAIIVALARAHQSAQAAAQDWANELKRKADTNQPAVEVTQPVKPSAADAKPAAKLMEKPAASGLSDQPVEKPTQKADVARVVKKREPKKIEGEFTDFSKDTQPETPEMAKAREAVRSQKAVLDSHITGKPTTTVTTMTPASISQPVLLAKPEAPAAPAAKAEVASVPVATAAKAEVIVLPAIRPVLIAKNDPAPSAPATTVPAGPATAAPASPAAAPVISSNSSGEKRLYAFQASDLELKAALAAFARANNLNIVPDNDVAGVVTLDVRDLPLDQMMRALLEASDCSWQEEHGLIRVRNFQTRTFTVDYLRLSRKGVGQSSAMLASGTSGGTSGGLGGSVAGGGGGMGGGAGGGMGGGGAPSTGGSAVNLTADNPIDFWKELKEEMGFMLTEKGKSSMAVNMTAGLVQVTDRPSALKRVEDYLSVIDRNVHRQVELEAKIYDITLNDQFEFGIDWAHVAQAYGGIMGFGSSTLPAAIGGGQLADATLGGLNTIPSVGSTTPGGNITTLVFQNLNTSAAITALQQQGKVEVISKPRIRTLNNQTALIKVGEEVPFFNTSTTIVPGTSAGTSTVLQQNLITSITVGTILSITPQISDDQYVSLDISPVLTTLKGVVFSGGTNSNSSAGGGASSASAPDLDTKQASTLVRVHDSTTVIIGGLIQTENAKSKRKVPVLGDIPLLGNLFTGTFDFKQKKELVMFVTPHIVHDGEVSVQTVPHL